MRTTSSRVEYVQRWLLDWIARHGTCPGMRLPSEQEIALRLKAGPVTVHKALRGLAKDGVVVRYHDRRGTFLKGAGVFPIGILGSRPEAHFFTDPYFGAVMAGIAKVVAEHKTVFFFKTPSSVEETCAAFLKTPIKGILVIGSALWHIHKEVVATLARQRPLIVIGAGSHSAAVNSIATDYFHDTFEGIVALLRRGHRRIAVFYNPRLKERLSGYKAALKTFGLPVEQKLIFKHPYCLENWTETTMMIQQMLPTALFDACGDMAVKILPTLLQAGVKPAILAYDDFFNTLSAYPLEITVLKQPAEQLGELAAKKLFALIDKKVKPPLHLRLRSQVVVKTP